jgi:hypothetical protein
MEKVGVTHRFEAFSPANSLLSITIVSKDFAFVRTLVRFCPSHAPLLPIILWSARAPRLSGHVADRAGQAPWVRP